MLDFMTAVTSEIALCHSEEGGSSFLANVETNRHKSAKMDRIKTQKTTIFNVL
jgi:hypothetical protein